jgi:hypothetical protein
MKRFPITISFLILITVLCSCVLFDTCSPKASVGKPDMDQVVNAGAQLKAIEEKYQSSLLTLQNRCDSLQTELENSKEKLKGYKFKLGRSQKEVLSLAKKDTSGKTITEQLTDCDSLKIEAIEYATIVDSTVCAYEAAMKGYEDLLATKNEQIIVCDSSFLQVKNLMEENLMRERKLTQDLQTAYKQQRKKAIQNKLLAGGMLILSGITTTLYINSIK